MMGEILSSCSNWLRLFLNSKVKSCQNGVISLIKLVICLKLDSTGNSRFGNGMAKTFQFVGHTLDLARSSLRTADREVQLRPKSFEVLVYLVENAERLVPKEELIKAIWPNVVV